ncbi:DUF1206 domain-containing protein [Angustibacter sp. McL0619]|uniref:DUF1206 domain-containing protein n=1 Tax=Angustibacter sp. McL0619 TaxID=3415676 RepID=UPI003CEA6F2E
MSTQDVTGQAGDAVRRAADSTWLERTARVGYVVSGLLHLLIAWIALRVAWTGSQAHADQSGALRLLAEHSWGKALLWLGVVGFAGLMLWQIADAVFGRHGDDAKERAGARVKAISKAVVYAALAYSSYAFARGAGKSSSSQTKDFTATVLSHNGGRIVVVLIGLVVIGVGGYHVYKGWTRGFHKDLMRRPGKAVEALAVAGYVAKGVALVIVGGLFCVAGVQRQPSEATGLDGALKTLREQPFGSWLLTIVALGLAAYGVYSFARARLARL